MFGCPGSRRKEYEMEIYIMVTYLVVSGLFPSNFPYQMFGIIVGFPGLDMNPIERSGIVGKRR